LDVRNLLLYTFKKVGPIDAIFSSVNC